MDLRIASWQQVGDPRHVFLGCHGLMTRNVLGAVEAGEFHHPAWVLTLLDMLQEQWADLDDEARASFHADHCHINAVIARTIDVVQDQVVERVSPAMNLVDAAMGRADEWLIAQLITRWRGRVWSEACALLNTHDAHAHRARLHTLETNVLRAARRIALQSM